MYAKGNVNSECPLAEVPSVKKSFYHAHSLATLMLTTALMGIMPLNTQIAYSQSLKNTAQSRHINYQIASQPLSRALMQFSKLTGMQLFFDANLVRGKNSAKVNGKLSTEDALKQLLSGSDLSFRVSGNTVTITQSGKQADAAADGSATLLNTITVVGENAWGPVDGYVATRTAAVTKTDTPIMETPQTVNIVTREQIERQGAQRVNQAVRYSAGVQSEGHGDVSRFDQFAFRGIAGVTDNNQFHDGLRLPRGTSYLIAQTDVWHLERLELLKGPSSVLYGQAPLAGIVNTVSKRPTSERIAEVDVLFGSHNRKQLAFDFSGALNNDQTWLYRLSGVGLDSKTSVNMTKEQRVSIAPSLTWQPDADTTFTLLTSYQRDPEGGYYGFLPYYGTVEPTPYGRLPRDFFDGSPKANEFDRKQASVGYSLDHKFNENWTIHQNFRYLRMDLDQSVVYSMALMPDNRTIARLGQWSAESMNAINVDTNLRGQFDTGLLGHQVVLGVDYQWDNWKQTFGYGMMPPLDAVNPDYSLPMPAVPASSSPDRKSNFFGLYAQDQIKIGNFNVLAGLRYDWASIDNKNALTKQSSSQDFGKLTWRLGGIYNFDNGIAPYVSYTTSFDPTVTANAYGKPFDPTTGQQFEVGVKYQPDGFSGIFTLSAFDLTQKNVLTRDPTLGAPINKFVQTGEINSRGVEFEARFNPLDNLNLIASFSWIDPKVTKSNGTDLDKRPVNTSKNLASLWADYTIADGAFTGLTLGAGIRYVGSAFADTENKLPVPSYVLADASFKYDFGNLNKDYNGLTASVAVSNIFDKTYYKCNALTACNYGEGRSVFGSLNYRW